VAHGLGLERGPIREILDRRRGLLGLDAAVEAERAVAARHEGVGARPDRRVAAREADLLERSIDVEPRAELTAADPLDPRARVEAQLGVVPDLRELAHERLGIAARRELHPL